MSQHYPANRGRRVKGAGGVSVGSCGGAGSVFELSESFFVLADAVGDGFEGGAEVGDLGGEAGEGVSVVAVAAVVRR